MKRRHVALWSAFLSFAVAFTLGAQQVPVDENLVAFMSDIHICAAGALVRKSGTFDTKENFRTCVQKVLALSPRPAAVIFLGDVTETGSENDAALFREMLRPLDAAGVRYLLAAGNHDSRATLFKVFPGLKDASRVPGKQAMVFELPTACFVLMDTTDPASGWEGRLDPEQLRWLGETLGMAPRKPLFLCGHHPLDMMKGDLPDLKGCPRFSGWICGHRHLFGLRPTPQNVPVLYVPSTGFNEDNQPLGLVLLRIDDRQFSFTLSTVSPADARDGQTLRLPRAGE